MAREVNGGAGRGIRRERLNAWCSTCASSWCAGAQSIRPPPHSDPPGSSAPSKGGEAFRFKTAPESCGGEIGHITVARQSALGLESPMTK